MRSTTGTGRARGEARGAVPHDAPPPGDGRLRPIAPELTDELFAALLGEGSEVTGSLLGTPAIDRALRRQIDHLLIGLADGARSGDRTANPKKVALAAPIGVLAAGTAPEDVRGVWDDLFEVLAIRMPRIADVLTGPDGDRPDEALLTVLLHRAVSARSHVCAQWHGSAREHRADQAADDERRRIARELHDWFGSNLSLAARRLEIHRAAPDQRHVDVVEKVVHDLFQGVRRYAAGLRAQEPVTDLGSELRAFVRERGPGGPRIEVLVRGEDEHLTGPVRDELFVILREAVRNVDAHARATRALVMVEIGTERVCAVVEDDGVGLEAGAHRPGSTGLVSIRERVDALHGDVVLTGRSGEGTRVELWIPTRGNR